MPLLTQLALRSDVPVERHRADPEFAAQFGHRRVAVGHRDLSQPHLGFRQRELSCRPCVREPARPLSPATVRSRISSRSNSASAAKMPNTRRPAAVVVSICAPWPASTRRPTPRADRSCTVLTRWARFRPRRSSFHATEHVALPQGAQAAVETRPVVAYAGREVVVQVDRVDAHGPQGVALQVVGAPTGSVRRRRARRLRRRCSGPPSAWFSSCRRASRPWSTPRGW